MEQVDGAGQVGNGRAAGTETAREAGDELVAAAVGQTAAGEDKRTAGQGGRRAQSKNARRRAFRLTQRDLELLRFLGRAKLARAEQVGLRFSTQRSKTYARLQALAALGFVRSERRVPGACVFLATRAGLRTAGLALAEARVSLVTLEHDLAVAAALAHLERETERATVLTERELRARLQAESSSPYRVRVRDTGHGRSGRHWPDLAVCGEGAWVAVEVELTQKRSDRTRSILSGYALHRDGLAGLVYLVPDERAGERIARLATKAGLSAERPPHFRVVSDPRELAPALRRIAADHTAWCEEREREHREAEERRRREEQARARREAEAEERRRQLREEQAAREREEQRLSSRLRRRVLG